MISRIHRSGNSKRLSSHSPRRVILISISVIGQIVPQVRQEPVPMADTRAFEDNEAASWTEDETPQSHQETLLVGLFWPLNQYKVTDIWREGP